MKLSHDKLKSEFPSIVDFALEGGDKTFIGLSTNLQHTSRRKQKEGLVLVKNT